INQKLFAAYFSQKTAPLPPLKNIDFWFSQKTQQDLAAVLGLIGEIENKNIRRFFAAAFAETARECSYTRNGEFKLYRMAAAQLKKFSPDVFAVFAAKLNRNFEGMRQYAAEVKKPGKTRVFDFNTVDGVPSKTVPPESADIVITSPPYGDSKTTVAYGQFSRLANEWLGCENAAAIDGQLMGGKPKKNGGAPLGCGKLEDAVGRIAKQYPARAREISAFYEDYRRSIFHVARVVAPGGVACYVVGNRKSKGVVLPTDEATKAYFAENGFKTVAVFARNIPNKRMPSKNSPTNIAGASDSTMQHEYIIIAKKNGARKTA
ncbi:MAG: DNA methyltransferase, partial [Betaproteobacteria bacterium]|nr:DNA methyltransferase [Betaproteobacteria bacterium]